MKKVSKVICTLVSEDGYTKVMYCPSKYTIDQIYISCGETKKRVENQMGEFSITYYPDEYYNLQKTSSLNIFSEQCYMKISVLKMYRRGSKYEKGEYVDEVLRERLIKSLKEEFGEKNAKEIVDFICETFTNHLKKEDQIPLEIDQKQIGNYQIDYYKYDNGLPEFYVSKK